MHIALQMLLHSYNNIILLQFKFKYITIYARHYYTIYLH